MTRHYDWPDIYAAMRLVADGGPLTNRRWNEERPPGYPVAQLLTRAKRMRWNELCADAGIEGGGKRGGRDHFNGLARDIDRAIEEGAELVPWSYRLPQGLQICRVREVGRWIYMEVR